MKYARNRMPNIVKVLIIFSFTAILTLLFSFLFATGKHQRNSSNTLLGAQTKATAPTAPQIDAETDFGGSSLATFNVIRSDKIILTSTSSYDVYYALRLTDTSETVANWYQDGSVAWTKLTRTEGKYYAPIPHTDRYISFAAITAVSSSSANPDTSKWSEFSETSDVTVKDNLRLSLTGPLLTDDFGKDLNNQSVFTDLYVKVNLKETEYSFGVKKVEIRSNGKLLDTYLADTDREHFIHSDGSQTGILTAGYIYIPLPTFGKEEMDRIGYGYQPKYQISVTDTVSRSVQIDLSFGLPEVSLVTYNEYFDDVSAISYTVRARNQLMKYDDSTLPGSLLNFSNSRNKLELLEEKYAALSLQITDFNEFWFPALTAFEKSQINMYVSSIMEAYKLQDSITDENVKKHLDTERLQKYVRDYITLAMTDSQVTVILPDVDLRDKDMLSYHAEVTRLTTGLDSYQEYATAFSASLQIKQAYRIRIFLGTQDITHQFKDTQITIKLNTYPDYNLNVMRPVCGISSGSDYLVKETAVEDQYCVFTVTGLENVVLVGMYASGNAFLTIWLPVLLSVVAAAIILLAILLYRKKSKTHARKIEEIRRKLERQKEKNTQAKKTEKQSVAKETASQAQSAAVDQCEQGNVSEGTPDHATQKQGENSDDVTNEHSDSGQTAVHQTQNSLKQKDDTDANKRDENTVTADGRFDSQQTAVSDSQAQKRNGPNSAEENASRLKEEKSGPASAERSADAANATAKARPERKAGQSAASRKTQTGGTEKKATAAKKSAAPSDKTASKKPNTKK